MSKLSICFLTFLSEKPTDVIVKKLKENKYITALKIGKEFIRGSEVLTISVREKIFPSGSDGKESICNAGDLGLIPVLGRSPGEGHGNPLQFLPGESHGWRSLVGYSLLVRKESDFYFHAKLTIKFIMFLILIML